MQRFMSIMFTRRCTSGGGGGGGGGGGVTVSYTEAFIKHFLSELWTGLLQPPDDNNGGASGHREPLNESDPDKGVER